MTIVLVLKPIRGHPSHVVIDVSVSLAVHGWDVSETGNVFGDWRGENGHCGLHGEPATLYAKFSCLMPTTFYCIQTGEGVSHHTAVLYSDNP